MHDMRMSRAQGVWLLACVVAVALNLRPSMAAVGPLLGAIREAVALDFAQASLLTMLPVMAMGLAMFFGLRLAAWLGLYRSISLSLWVIGLATLARLFADSTAALIVTAVAAGLGIAMIQALMPVLIKTRFRANVALCMGLYVTAIMGGAALAASLAPTVQGLSGDWRAGLAVWSGLAVFALLLWAGQRARVQNAAQAGPAVPRPSFVRLPRAWLLGIFFGLGTAAYTCVLAWLAPYYVELGWSGQQAGLLLGYLTLMEVVSGLVTPALANRSRDRRWVLAALLGLILCGFAGLIFAPLAYSLVWASLLGLGIGGLFPMSLIVSMDHLDDGVQAGALTAFVQGIGYLIASLSPLLAGLLRDQLGNFSAAWLGLGLLVAAMLLMVVRFDPHGYARHMQVRPTGPAVDAGRTA
ncbi:cyanate transporter [Pseudomonas sp. DTU_2021_1001937_2_SI_NGA_ILE_001]|uniref:cyanate transporter n=1 Tax=Pseudomonas sp. DTU_2021_1001937_2_SI_NGA_ILE_001 TaxID=3077589 RepID=UPI0028FC16C4|nr:cyanate transporter [Pseudomonas sp. DTU_2021_1001937_2_SI_NGA_ILE_001]WNW14187.1 cyanate transporter [Pseudomonas sp. DTU_2021_1001937_2_SI_NGA_ILE_001]